jgi:hypothetical protein
MTREKCLTRFRCAGVNARNKLTFRVAFIAVVSLFATLHAHAEPRARVVLLTADRESTTVHRLEAELRTLDVEVIVVAANGDNQSIRKELQRVARDQGAFAAVRIVPSGNEAEVWVMDRVTGKTLVREVVSGKDAGTFDDAISLGAVELLRASLLEVSGTTELKGDVPAPVAVKALLPPPRKPSPTIAPAPETSPAAYLVVAIEPAVDFGVERLTTGSSLELDLKVVSVNGWGAELVGRSPFSGQKVHKDAGTAEIRSQQFGILGCYAPQNSKLSPTISLGFFAANVTASGQTESTLRTQEQRRLRLLPVTRVGLGWKILPSVTVRTDATLGYALTPLEIRIAGHDAANYGRPIVALALGFELRLPLDAGK